MKLSKRMLILVIFFLTNLTAQDKELKDVYTEVTTAINTALLTKSGAMELSGFVSYNYFNTDYTSGEKLTQSTLQAEPSFSYFILDNMSLGITAAYHYEKMEYDIGGNTVSDEQTFVGPIAKMYFGDEQYRPFVFADYLFLTGDNFEGGELDLGAGLFYHATGNFGFSLFGKYGIIWPSKDEIDQQNRIFIGIGISNFIL